MDHSLAGTDHRPEQPLDLTALSRKVAPGPSVIDRLVHGCYVTTLFPNAPDAMHLIMVKAAKPLQILGHVSATLRAERSVVNVYALPAAAVHVTGLIDVSQSEAP